jgi:hypothetical protein
MRLVGLSGFWGALLDETTSGLGGLFQHGPPNSSVRLSSGSKSCALGALQFEYKVAALPSEGPRRAPLRPCKCESPI